MTKNLDSYTTLKNKILNEEEDIYQSIFDKNSIINFNLSLRKCNINKKIQTARNIVNVNNIHKYEKLNLINSKIINSTAINELLTNEEGSNNDLKKLNLFSLGMFNKLDNNISNQFVENFLQFVENNVKFLYDIDNIPKYNVNSTVSLFDIYEENKHYIVNSIDYINKKLELRSNKYIEFNELIKNKLHLYVIYNIMIIYKLKEQLKKNFYCVINKEFLLLLNKFVLYNCSLFDRNKVFYKDIFIDNYAYNNKQFNVLTILKENVLFIINKNFLKNEDIIEVNICIEIIHSLFMYNNAKVSLNLDLDISILQKLLALDANSSIYLNKEELENIKSNALDILYIFIKNNKYSINNFVSYI